MFCSEALNDGSLVAAVADGAGSARCGGDGAEIATRETVRYVSEGLARGREDLSKLLIESVERAREILLQEAELNSETIREYACTLLLIVVTPTNGAALQIGDGLIAVSDASDDWYWVFWPQRGEYANTTYFLTDGDALERLQVEVLPGSLLDVAIISDGLQAMALQYSAMIVHAPFFKGLFRPLWRTAFHDDLIQLEAALEAFLGSSAVRSRTDDDVTAVLATRREVGGSDGVEAA